MLKTRDKISRQLRFLFIYPLVYIGMWIFPFVSQIMQYDDKYALNPPFGLTCVTTICVCSQAAVDCWLFSTRERPWKHIPGTDGGFFSSLKPWTGWKGFSKRRVKAGPGKTREEMNREARSAYRRRDEEMAQRKSEAGIAAALQNPSRPEKSWWENAGLDGTTGITPALEASNPMEGVIPPIVRQERVHFRVPEDEESAPVTRMTSREGHASN
jgi:G protein-coupled receptor GPR1